MKGVLIVDKHVLFKSFQIYIINLKGVFLSERTLFEANMENF